MRTPFLLSLLAALLLMACNSETQTQEADTPEEPTSTLSVEKLSGSPAFGEASLSLMDAQPGEDGMYNFTFEVAGYELGAQTDQPMPLANSGKGQHIHFIVDNGPYAAHYTPEVSTDKLAEPGNHVVLAFLSRSYHESVKNTEPPTSYFLGQYQTGEGEFEEADFSAPHMFYSRPKGTYKAGDYDQLLLDFFLFNIELSPEGNKVRATINGEEFMLTEWAPYVIKGLEPGEATVKLELIDAEGNAVPGPFNTVERSVTLEAPEAATE